MYNYPHYKEPDREKIVAFMKEHPFITLIGADKTGRIELTQVPVLLEEKHGKIFLAGHMSRKSDHQHALEDNPDVVALFTSPHVYVSGSWYSGNPHQASTWNYISVHARGKIKWMNEEGLIGLLKKLTLHFENYNRDSSTIYDNLPAEYLDRLKKAIVGFEIEVTELENVHKLSQNRDEKSYYSIMENLEKQGGDGKYIAGRMKENASRLFKKES